MSAFPSSAEPTKGYASHEEACPVVQIKTIGTEQRNPNTLEIDRADTAEILRLMNEEDKKVAPAVEQVLPQVEKAVDVIYAHMRCGGRLIYCGCRDLRPPGRAGRIGMPADLRRGAGAGTRCDRRRAGRADQRGRGRGGPF